MSQQTHFYQVRGLELAYHTWGDQESPMVLCLHGFLDHGLSFAEAAEELSKDYYLVAPDMRGHGHSSWVGEGGYYHFYDYINDMRTLLELMGDRPMSIIGHSMGGSVAVATASVIDTKVEAMVLLEGIGPPFHDIADGPTRLKTWSEVLAKSPHNLDVAGRRAARRVMDSLEAAADRLQSTNRLLSRERALRLAASFTEPQEDGVVFRFDPLHRTPSAKPYLQGEAEALWRSIDAPVLSLFGQKSGFLPGPLQPRHDCLKDVLVGTVPDAGHNLHHDQPQLVAQAAAAWFGGQRSLLPTLIPETPQA